MARSSYLPPVWYRNIASRERLERIDRMCIALARYARQPLPWLWSLPFAELRYQYRLLGEVIDAAEDAGDFEDHT